MTLVRAAAGALLLTAAGGAAGQRGSGRGADRVYCGCGSGYADGTGTEAVG